MKIPDNVEKAILDEIKSANSNNVLIIGKTISVEAMLKERIETILKTSNIYRQVKITAGRRGYGVVLLPNDIEFLPYYMPEMDDTFFFPERSCPFCKNCTDVLWDYTNGPYIFFCKLGLDGTENGGMDGKCESYILEEHQ